MIFFFIKNPSPSFPLEMSIDLPIPIDPQLKPPIPVPKHKSSPLNATSAAIPLNALPKAANPKLMPIMDPSTAAATPIVAPTLPQLLTPLTLIRAIKRLTQGISLVVVSSVLLYVNCQLDLQFIILKQKTALF